MLFTERKGMGMLEMLVVILLMAGLSLLTLNKDQCLKNHHYGFMNDYLRKQSEALAQRELTDFDGQLYFYPNGNISRGKTYRFGTHKVIVHLGNGYISYE